MTYTGGTTGLWACSPRTRADRDGTHGDGGRGADERDIVGVVTPMFHVAALNIMFQSAVLATPRSRCYALSADGFREMARNTGMTANFMVPTQAIQVVQDPNFDPRAYISGSNAAACCSPCPIDAEGADGGCRISVSRKSTPIGNGVIAVNR